MKRIINYITSVFLLLISIVTVLKLTDYQVTDITLFYVLWLTMSINGWAYTMCRMAVEDELKRAKNVE